MGWTRAVIPELAVRFPVDPSLIMLNHASYGLAGSQLMDEVEAERRSIERDPLTALGSTLTERLRVAAGVLGDRIGAAAGSVTLVANATEASVALTTSLLRGRPIRVVAFSTEYSAVLRAWSARVEATGGTVQIIDVPVPVTTVTNLMARLDSQVISDFDVLAMSLVTSSTATAMPVDEVVTWARGRGARVVLDAAHGVGHLPVDVAAYGVDAVFGTLHKWLPVPRPAGFLWLAPDLQPTVRPAMVTLHWDDADLVRRFSWRGTWDPAPLLRLESALAVTDVWQRQGLIEQACARADEASELLTELGLTPTAPVDLLPPRLRAFLTPVPADALLAALDHSRIRASVNPHGAGSVLRISTHIFTSGTDIATLRDSVQRVLTGG